MRLDKLISPAIAALLRLLILEHCPKTLQVVLVMCVLKLISSFQQLHSLWVLLFFFPQLLFLFLNVIFGRKPLVLVSQTQE